MTPPQASPTSSQSSGLLAFSSPALKRALTPKLTPWIRQSPTAPQRAFLLLSNREALYGGAAGGGKSSALLSAALQYVDVPSYSAVLFRRTYADLAKPGALMSRAMEWLSGTAARWNEQKHTWKFPSGATLSFGHLETENSKYDHQGAEYQFIGFDELTQFSETQYKYMHSRLRRLKGHQVPLRVRASSNPGGAGHEWVFNRFFVEPTDRANEAARRRVFIPAKLADNPHLDQEEYRTSLSELDPVTRRQLEHGDWRVRQAGEMFDRRWFELVDSAPHDCRWVRYWDTAATEQKPGKKPDFTFGMKLGVSRGIYYIAHCAFGRWGPAKVEDMLAQTAREDGHDVIIWMGEERGSAGKLLVSNYARTILRGYAVHGWRETGDKVTRAQPASSAAEKGHIKMLRGSWNSELLDQLEAFPTVGVHDDGVDALSGAMRGLVGDDVEIDERPRKAKKPKSGGGIYWSDM
jgi:predicted phage terminase large subunit-like protein